MNKKVFLFPAAALLFMASCNSSSIDEPMPTPETGETKDVTVEVNIPDNSGTDSRAFTETTVNPFNTGAEATTLWYCAYDKATGSKLTNEAEATLTSGKATVSVKLPAGLDCEILFFAYHKNASGSQPYTINASNKTVTRNANVLPNGSVYSYNKTSLATATTLAFYPIYDCFYKKLDVAKNAAAALTETLTRPVAQINFWSDDLVSADFNNTKSAFETIYGANVPFLLTYTLPKAQYYTTFNMWTGEVGAASTSDYVAPYRARYIPAGATGTLITANFTRNGSSVKHALIASDFFFAKTTGGTVNLPFNIAKYNGTATDGYENTVSYSPTNVPVKANVQTNIIGSFLYINKGITVTTSTTWDTPQNTSVN